MKEAIKFYHMNDNLQYLRCNINLAVLINSVCSSPDELGIQKNVQYTQRAVFNVLYGFILGICGVLNTLWGKTVLDKL